MSTLGGKRRVDHQERASFELACGVELAGPLAFTVLLSASLPDRLMFRACLLSTGLM